MIILIFLQIIINSCSIDLYTKKYIIMKLILIDGEFDIDNTIFKSNFLSNLKNKDEDAEDVKDVKEYKFDFKVDIIEKSYNFTKDQTIPDNLIDTIKCLNYFMVDIQIIKKLCKIIKLQYLHESTWPNLMNLYKKFPNKSWNLEVLAFNKCISVKFIKEICKLHLKKNKKINDIVNIRTMNIQDLVKLKNHNIDLYNITSTFLEYNSQYLNSESCIESIISPISDILENHRDIWTSISMSKYITVDFINRHLDYKWSWIYLCSNEIINDEFLEKNFKQYNKLYYLQGILWNPSISDKLKLKYCDIFYKKHVGKTGCNSEDICKTSKNYIKYVEFNSRIHLFFNKEIKINEDIINTKKLNFNHHAFNPFKKYRDNDISLSSEENKIYYDMFMSGQFFDILNIDTNSKYFNLEFAEKYPDLDWSWHCISKHYPEILVNKYFTDFYLNLGIPLDLIKLIEEELLCV